MSKIKKTLLIIIMIIFINILSQNTVNALDENNDGWDDPRSFSIGSVEGPKQSENNGWRFIFNSTIPSIKYRINRVGSTERITSKHGMGK